MENICSSERKSDKADSFLLDKRPLAGRISLPREANRK